MFFASRPIIRRRKGVSEVMGALLLIVVVIIAVATLASFIAVSEKNAQARQSYLTNLKNENLQIVSAQFFQSPTDSTTWDAVLLSIRNTNTQPSVLSQIKIGSSWASNWEEIGSAQSPVITITTTTMITNTETTITSTTATTTGTTYTAGAYMTIPAKATVYIYVDFGSDFPSTAVPILQTDQSIPITLLTVMGNFFTTVYNPPTAVARVSVASVSYQDYNRDVVFLDGSQSTTANQSTIVSYDWNISVPYVSTLTSGSAQVNPDGCISAAFSELKTPNSALPPVYAASVTGKTTQFLQESSLPAPLANYCLTGPFEVSLTVTDSMGFVGTSSPTIIAKDPNMAPLSSFSAALINASIGGPCTVRSTGCNVTGTVTTIFGTPPPLSTYVTILYNGNSVPVEINDTGGYSQKLSCVSGATVQVSLDTLPSQTLQCPMVSQSIITVTSISTSVITTGVHLSVNIVPSSVSIDIGQSALLTAYVVGSASSYTWYTSSSDSCSNGQISPITGATSSSYTVSPTSSTTSGSYFYCVQVSSALGIAMSPPAIVTVYPALAVTISPSNPTYSGTSILLTAYPSGGSSSSYSYAWYTYQSSTSTCTGLLATSSSYTVSSPTSTTIYCVQVTDSIGNTATATDLVTVTLSAVISASPIAISPGSSATLSTIISFTGGVSPYTCQWLEEPPGTTSYTSLGSSFSCNVGNLPTTSTGALSTAGSYYFELQVTDSESPPEIQVSNAVTVTVT